MTAGLSARQAEVGTPNIPRPVSSTPLHPQSTTDSFQNLAVHDTAEPELQVQEPVAPQPSAASAPVVEPEAQAPAPAAPQQQVQAPARTEAPVQPAPPKPAPAPEAAPSWGAPQQEQAAASEPAAPAASQRMSRYQQLMNQAKSSPSAPAPTQAAGGWGGPSASASPVQNQELEEFVPSDDDIEVEDSALIGVPAVERLLGGMVIEQRDVNGNVVEIKRSL